MVEKFELSYGRHENFYYNCAGCLISNSIWAANTPQPIFLILTYLDKDRKPTRNVPYCLPCAGNVIDEMKRGLVDTRPEQSRELSDWCNFLSNHKKK